MQGSDHCPVYATFKDPVTINESEIHLLDLMNPPGMFNKGRRQREYSTKDILPLSGRLIPEFDGRRSIRDMFTRKPSIQSLSGAAPSIYVGEELAGSGENPTVRNTTQGSTATLQASAFSPSSSAASSATSADKKRPSTDAPASRSLKRSKSNSAAAVPAVAGKGPAIAGKGQQSLKGFLKPKPTMSFGTASTDAVNGDVGEASNLDEAQVVLPLQPIAGIRKGTKGGSEGKSFGPCTPSQTTSTHPVAEPSPFKISASPSSARCSSTPTRSPIPSPQHVHDPIASAESWSKLFTKPAAPCCEGHNEPCITLLTKKSGMNCGRSFWMCPRPLGPSGAKERNTQWRCQTFIWCSDWRPGELLM